MFIDGTRIEAAIKGSPAGDVILPASVLGSWADKFGAAIVHPTVNMKSRRKWKLIQPPRRRTGSDERVAEAWSETRHSDP
jgi:hypothetical protein